MPASHPPISSGPSRLELFARIASRTSIRLALGAAICCLPRASAQVCLEADRPIEVGVGAAGAAGADFDGDGLPDMAVANHESDTVSVLFGRGQHQFAPQVQYPTGSMPSAILVADLNGDGHPDVVVTNAGANTISILLNLGSGTFAAHVDTSVGVAPGSVTGADLDGDGDVDLVVANWGSNTISVLLNQGQGTFAPDVQYPVPGTLRGVTTGDFDADGDVDIATSSGSLGVLMNAGNGTFSPPVSYVVPFGAQGTLAIQAGDIDGDGDLDVLIATPHGLFFCRNQGPGTFDPVVSAGGGGGASQMALLDVEGDGDLDIATSNPQSGNVAVTMNQGPVPFTVVSTYAIVAYGVAVLQAADLDGDGDTDLFGASSWPGTSALVVLWNDGTGMFSQPELLNTSSPPDNMVVDDFDGDGDSDLAVAESHSVEVFLNVGNGTLVPGPTTLLSGTQYSFTAADVDGDGDVDLLAANGTGFVSVLFNQGTGAFVQGGSYVAGGDVFVVTAADFDGDGDVDLAVIHYPTFSPTAGTVALLWNQGNGTFSAPVDLLLNGPVQTLASEDLDGDGDPDLIVSDIATSDLCVLLNQGNGTFAAGVCYPTVPGARAALCRDLDDDGDIDVVMLKESGPPYVMSLVVMLNQGNGTFGPKAIWSAGRSVTSFIAEDLDGDGALELITTNAYSDTVDVLPNTSAGTFGAPEHFGIFDHPTGVAALDVDSDGDEDLVVLCRFFGLFVIRNCKESGTAFCAGDGSGTQCPCGNDSASGDNAGCLSSIGSGSALRGTGSARISSDQLVLNASQTPNAATLYFQGTASVGGGGGAVFGDGLRCVGGTITRLGSSVGVGNQSHYPAQGQSPVSVRGGVTTPGPRNYQVWYRNAAPFCTASTFNLTNGLTVTWNP